MATAKKAAEEPQPQEAPEVDQQEALAAVAPKPDEDPGAYLLEKPSDDK